MSKLMKKWLEMTQKVLQEDLELAAEEIEEDVDYDVDDEAYESLEPLAKVVLVGKKEGDDIETLSQIIFDKYFEHWWVDDEHLLTAIEDHYSFKKIFE